MNQNKKSTCKVINKYDASDLLSDVEQQCPRRECADTHNNDER